MEFLGHQVGGDVITPSRDNLEKVRNTPRPTTKKQVLAVLLQENDGKLYPVGYASKKLNLTEARYPIIEKECLAVV